LAVQASDLLICIGARFDDRATGKLDEFAPNAKIIHCDADVSEINKLRKADFGLPGDLLTNVDALSDAWRGQTARDIGQWRKRCRTLAAKHAWRYDAPGEGIYAPALLRELAERGGDRLRIACDVGQHQMWVAQHC